MISVFNLIYKNGYKNECKIEQKEINYEKQNFSETACFKQGVSENNFLK